MTSRATNVRLVSRRASNLVMFRKLSRRTLVPTKTLDASSTVKHKKLVAWVDEMAALCKPDQVYWCNGSQQEYDRLCHEMVASGTFIKLNEEKRPGCFLARSHPSD